MKTFVAALAFLCVPLAALADPPPLLVADPPPLVSVQVVALEIKAAELQARILQLEKSLAEASLPKPPVVKPLPPAKQAATVRQPNGHTHTCTSCGTTWDHTENPTHTCANCGGHPPISRGGYLADSTPKVIVVPPLQTAPRRVTTSSWSIQSLSSPNCANGQCSAPRYFR
jgi:hypothetical protein